jgi:molybdopterin converting factor subunit 1
MKVLFFARLREALGAASLTLPDGVRPADVAALRRWLQETQPAELAEALRDANVFCAVNQRVVDDRHPIHAGDEIAFFPPVTGG